VAVGGVIAEYALLRYLGDAARYLSPTPRNIELRRQIREDGLKLLAALHESGEYDRIVLVGHSLGSVIAYDLVRHYWAEVGEHFDKTPDEVPDQQRLLALESAGTELVALFADGKAPKEEELSETLEAFRTAQTACWKECRALGHRWLVTDLITLGSPLAHAKLLLAQGEQDLRARVRQRELPTCPPVPDKGYDLDDARETAHTYSYQWSPAFTSTNRKYRPRILHSGAPFALTRWTNLFFPTRYGFKGDLIGGAVAPSFGRGVKDMKVSTGRVRDRTPLAHVDYWWRKDDEQSDALKELRDALALEDGALFEPLEPAT